MEEKSEGSQCGCSSVSCGCGQQECSCGSCSSGCSSESGCCENSRLAMMLCLAKEAKMELIREKVKKSLEAADGKRLDKIADLLVEAMLEHKKDRTSMANKWSELNEKFESTLME